MTDKTTPDERNRRPDAAAPTDGTHDRGDASAARTSESAVAASKAGNERVDAPAPPSTKVAAPLITAVEIENFKGIGRPMRVEFRPITLLFGNNSAGKSTVLHALCYAHEILSYGNVDAHKTDLGGDRIDLGGFRNFVHAHDPARTVRLRFELHLGNWSIPQGLDDKLASPLDPMGGSAEEYVFHGSESLSSGWIELQAKLRDEQPALSSYELGVNDALVGRLLPRQPTGVSLAFDPTHPLLERRLRPRPVGDWVKDQGSAEVAETDKRANRVREATGADGGDWKETRMEVLGLSSPLPHWNEVLFLDDHGRSYVDGYDLDLFTAMVSALFVGIGQALRDELARFRYIGPVRDIHPRTRIASSARDRAIETPAADLTAGRATVSGPQSAGPGSWADGSAAWIHLHTSSRRDLIEDVSNWIAREDRLDTGYALRARTIVTIYEEDAQLISTIREYEQLRKTYGNAEGSIDLSEWARAKSKTIVDQAGLHDRQTALAHCDRLRAKSARIANGTPTRESADDLTRQLQAIVENLAMRKSIEPGIRRNAERIRRLAEDLRRLLTLSVQDIESQITGSGENLIESSETLTPAYCRRMKDLLPKWEDNALVRIYSAAILDGLRAMPRDEDKSQKLDALMHSIEDLRGPDDVSAEVQQLLGRFQKAIQATVGSARRTYRRLATLVATVENRNLPSGFAELAAAIAAHPPQREIDLITTKNALPVRVADVGVGISQVLPVVVAALDTDRPGITAIEQPELHLHPRMQVELGDLFAQPLDDGRVFLLENHSEHLMLRLLRRIEETHSGELPEGKPALRPDQVSVVFLEQIDGEVRATPLRIDKTGEFIDRWPHGFFRERAAELF